jgi:Flp pilus assembly protein TadB
MEIYNKALEAQKKAEHLQERRQRLSALLHSEATQYEAELARQKGQQSSHHRVPLEDLKSVNYELKRREEDNKRRERELKLYHQWRMKQPSIREVSVMLCSVCCVFGQRTWAVIWQTEECVDIIGFLLSRILFSNIMLSFHVFCHSISIVMHDHQGRLV